jgi:predicted extracellular nuclease
MVSLTSRRKLLAVAALALPAALLQVISMPTAKAVSPDIVISEIYGGGGNSGATFTHDFIELYNRGATTVSVSGWSVQYASSAGTTWQVTNLVGEIPAGQHYLVQEAQGAAGTTPLPTPDATGVIPMSGTSGKVALVTNTTALTAICGGNCDSAIGVRDYVGYGAAATDYEGSGPTPTLSNTAAAQRNSTGTDTDDNAVDFTVGDPAPCNSACPPPPPPCEVPTHEIAAIQGSGDSTPLAGQQVCTEGIITGDFNGTGGLGGFYMQDDSPDADPQTSEGIFVASSSPDVAVGDRVRVDGTAAESFNETRLNSPTITVVSTGNPLPPATTYDLPRPVGVTFEPVEGMLLTFPEGLSVTEHFQLGRFGEVTVSSDGRLFQPTNVVEPGAPAVALAAENARRRLLVDDGSTVQNPFAVPYVSPGETLRIGDTTSGITGVLGFGFSNFRLQPTAPITFTETNPRPAAPEAVGGDVKVASFNTLNYFTTLTTTNSNARGANSAAEFARQQAKEVEAITGIDADVVGLMEVENNGSTAIGNLVDALNDATAPGTYAYITEPALNPPNEFGGEFGTDAIKVALIYRPAAVTPVGAAQTSADAAFDRPPLIQTFERVGGSEEFTVVVNHFKSKNCAAGSPPEDQDSGDGQSCFNGRRVLQATTLADVLDTLTVPNPLLVGDLNSYAEEDPIGVLEEAGYTGLTELFVSDDDRYSFVFDGFSGELDHAMASPELLDNVTGATIWHINADEPLILDYNLDFGRDPALYQPDAYRTSDHDPLIVGLSLPGNEAPTVDAGGPYEVTEGSTVTLTATGSDPENGPLTYAWDLDDNGSFETAGQSVEFSAAGLQAPATVNVAVQVTDDEGHTGTDTATVQVTFDFGGFLGTVASPPAVNTVKAGSTVPIKFSLNGFQGLNILAAGSPSSSSYTCGTTPPDPGGGTPTSSKSGLTYSAPVDAYSYSWRTQKNWKGTCRQFELTFTDGTTYTAKFMFN